MVMETPNDGCCMKFAILSQLEGIITHMREYDNNNNNKDN